MSFNSKIVKSYGSTIVALTGVTTGTTTAGPTLAVGGALSPEWDSICANVSAGVTTSSLVVKTQWQVSNDGTTWANLFGLNSAAIVAVAATGSGTLVTTAWAQHLPMNSAYPYVRLSVTSSGATGAAGDNVTISYNFRKRSI